MSAPRFAQNAYRATSRALSQRPGVLFRRNAPVQGSSANAGTVAPRRWISSYPRYPFPNIPRPKRNLLYYPMGSLKRRLSQLPSAAKKPISFIRRTSFNFQGIRYTLQTKFRRIPLGGHKSFVRGYGSIGAAYGQNQGDDTKKMFLKFWAIPAATTVILWSVMRRQRRDPQAPREVEGNALPPWKVSAYSTLPLKAMSRWWGWFNDIDLPVWMRSSTYKLYSYLFGVNLSEVAEEDLRAYNNLGEFFYRELKPGARSIDEDSPLVSPADGTVLQLGIIDDGQVEQVKGVTYSLDALLGNSGHAKLAAPSHQVPFEDMKNSTNNILERHREFAIMNGISYTVDDLIGDGNEPTSQVEDQGDATTNARVPTATTQRVARDLFAPAYKALKGKELFFTVIYLAPGDYHRFHSPANWVSQLRRHFVGELYSVAPYFQNRLSNLFVLNERVALLGKWKYGFFSMTPVGATNVGSIRVHFDKDLVTNTVYENDSSSAKSVASSNTSSTITSSKRKRVQKKTCYEATYRHASPLLGGYPLLKGQQMGGFNLGSTVVLVFEAPKNFRFNVSKGQHVKVGEALGSLAE